MKKIVLRWLLIVVVGFSTLNAEELVYKNRDTALQIVREGGYSHPIEDLDDVYKKDREIVLEAVKNSDYCILDEFDKFFQKDKEVLLASLKTHGCGLEYADETLRDDASFMLEVVIKNPEEFKHISPRLQSDEAFVLKVLKDAPSYAFDTSSIDRKLLANKHFVLKAIALNDDIYYDIPTELKKDREVAFAMVKSMAWNIDKINEEFRRDKKILSYALKKGEGIEYADKNITSNKEIIRKIVQKTSSNFKYADESLKKDREFILSIIDENNNLSILEYIDKSLLNDREFMIPLIDRDEGVAWDVGESLKSDPLVLSIKEKYEKKERDKKEKWQEYEYALSQIKNENFDGLEFMDKSFWNNKELVLAYASSAHLRDYGWDWVKDKMDAFLQDKAFVIELVKVFHKSFPHLDEKFRRDREVVFAYLESHPSFIDEIDKSLKVDSAFIEEVIEKTGHGLEYATTKQQDNPTLVLKAIEKNKKALVYASKRLKKDKAFIIKVLKIDRELFYSIDKSLQADKLLVMFGYLLADRKKKTYCE